MHTIIVREGIISESTIRATAIKKTLATVKRLQAHHVLFGITSFVPDDEPWKMQRFDTDVSVFPPISSAFSPGITENASLNARKISLMGSHTMAATMTDEQFSFLEDPYMSVDELKRWKTEFSADESEIADWFRFGFTTGRASLWKIVGMKVASRAYRRELEGEAPIISVIVNASPTNQYRPTGMRTDRLNDTRRGVLASSLTTLSECDVFSQMLKWHNCTSREVILGSVDGITSDYLDEAQWSHQDDLTLTIRLFRAGTPSEWVGGIMRARGEALGLKMGTGMTDDQKFLNMIDIRTPHVSNLGS